MSGERQEPSFIVDARKTGTPTLTLPGLVDADPAQPGEPGAQRPISLLSAEEFGGGLITTRAWIRRFGPQRHAAAGRQVRRAVRLHRDGRQRCASPAGERSKSITDIFSLDNIGPSVTATITLPNDLDGDKTTAARNYDGSNAISVTVAGTDTAARRC